MLFIFEKRLMSTKIQTALKLNKDLLEVLKEKAKADKRSLNNYIEFLLYRTVEEIPNEKTKLAIEEARTNSSLEKIDNVDDFFEKL